MADVSCSHLDQIEVEPPAPESVIVRSLQPGEDWCWCYEDEVVFAVDFD